MKHDFFTIKSFGQSAFSEIMNPDNRVKVELPTGGSSLTDTELRASTLDVKQVSGSADSVRTHGLARTTNPAAIGDGLIVPTSHDDLGRPLITPIQVRDLIATAYASVTNVTETTLLAGIASTFLDLIYVKFSNQSTGAVNVGLRGSTGGTVMDIFSIPANSTVGYVLPRPMPQGTEAGSVWTFQNQASDDSTTSISVSALFSKEI